MNIPFELMKLIAIWYTVEYIHIIEEGGNNRHWEINVDQILDV